MTNHEIKTLSDFSDRLKRLKERDPDQIPFYDDGFIDIETADFNIFMSLDRFLIAPQGKPNWENINILRSEGIRVGPGETDSFGWVTGIVYLSHERKILF